VATRLLFIFCLISGFTYGQSGVGRQVLSRIEKQDWQKALQSIEKALKKDSTTVDVIYAAAVLYASPPFDGFSPDTAHHFIQSASFHYQYLPAKEKEKLLRLPLDSTRLTILQHKIDSLAFSIAREKNTADAYQHFVDRYESAKQQTQAVALRDEAAFNAASVVGTYQSFGQFLNRYPKSAQAKKAKEMYDKLIYEDRTRDGRLTSFENFIREFPDNRYRGLAEQHILKVSTAAGTIASFEDFIAKYPHSQVRQQAINLLYHLDDRFYDRHADWMNDSLRSVHQLNASYWVPFMASGSFGFMDSNGDVKISASLQNINEDYLCGDVRDDYISTTDGVYGRNQNIIYKGDVTSAEDIGKGFIRIKSGEQLLILHKSGTPIETSFAIQDAALLGDHFLQLKSKDGWGIVSFTGLVLIPPHYEEIISFDNWMVLSRNGKKTVVTTEQIGRAARGEPLPGEFVFDEVKRWGDKLCWVRNGPLEGVIDESLAFVIPLDRQTLASTPFGFLRKKENSFQVVGLDAVAEQDFQQVKVNGRWMYAQAANGSKLLFDMTTRQQIKADADTIWFEKNIAVVKSRDSVRAWINPEVYIDLNSVVRPFLLEKEGEVWLVADDKNRKTVYDAISGEKLFTFSFDMIEPLSKGFFLITKNNRKGVLDSHGKVVLPLEYEAIVQQQPERLSLLKDKKFGLYDLTTKTSIKPTYERNLLHYANNWFIAYKNGGWGFVQPQMKAAPTFVFEEIQYWNDTAAWVKDGTWKIYDFRSKKVLLDEIVSFKYVKKYAHEYVAIVRQGNAYGVISNRNGIVLQPSFSLIINLGDADKPLYFTEKHIAEADIYVVIYYNAQGKLLRRQALEEDEYEQLVCAES